MTIAESFKREENLDGKSLMELKKEFYRKTLGLEYLIYFVLLLPITAFLYGKVIV